MDVEDTAGIQLVPCGLERGGQNKKVSDWILCVIPFKIGCRRLFNLFASYVQRYNAHFYWSLSSEQRYTFDFCGRYHQKIRGIFLVTITKGYI